MALTLTTEDLTAIENAIWNALQSNHTTVGSYGESLDVILSTRQSTSDSITHFDNLQNEHHITQAAVYNVDVDAEEIADAVWDELRVEHTIVGSFGETTGTPAGSGITQEQVAEAVWNANMTSYTTSGSFGSGIDFLKQIEGGRWVIDESSNQMVFYRDDNVTEVARFNLKDGTGFPSSTTVLERSRS